MRASVFTDTQTDTCWRKGVALHRKDPSRHPEIVKLHMNTIGNLQIYRMNTIGNLQIYRTLPQALAFTTPLFYKYK